MLPVNYPGLLTYEYFIFKVSRLDLGDSIFILGDTIFIHQEFHLSSLWKTWSCSRSSLNNSDGNCDVMTTVSRCRRQIADPFQTCHTFFKNHVAKYKFKRRFLKIDRSWWHNICCNIIIFESLMLITEL